MSLIGQMVKKNDRMVKNRKENERSKSRTILALAELNLLRMRTI